MMDPRRWEEIQSAFDELVELDGAGRASRLAALGSNDPELRAAVESLLTADAEADGRLAPLEAALLSPARPPPDPLSLAGRTVSHFRVLEPLGAGGMGVVYRAEDTRLGRAVALKFLLPHYSLDASAKARFLQEAHSAAALDHPNLCTVHEIGESEDGRLFLAMGLYPGETLKARLDREGPLPLVEALEIARQIAQGLVCAHAAGIVHRDLKPGNVMLVPDGPMKILDFGLAKARGESISDSSARLGTASYMAPEQVRKEAVDGRADLWALGVVLYEMLTGKKPFAGEHVAGVAHAIVYDDPVPPSALRAEVPTSVEALVLRLLHKDPAMRHSTAEDVLTALLGVGAPAESAVRSARTPSLHIRPILSGKRQWVLAVVATVIMGVVGVVVGRGILVGRSGDGDAGAASRVVVMPFENRTGVTELDPLGVMVAEWVTQGLTEAPFLTVLDTRGAQAATRTLGAEAGPITVGRETGAGVVVAGSFFLQGDSLQFLAQISSTADGGVLFGIAGIAARRDRPLEGAEQLRQRVLAAFASRHDKDVSSFEIVLSQPPTYAAYREYVEGLETIMGIRPGDFRGAAQRFLQAAMLDTTFLTARVWAAQAGMLARLYGSFQDRLGVDETWAKRADSLISGLQLLRDRLTPFDRARLDFVVALGASDLLEVYRAALRLVDASPGSVDARREAAMAALRVLRPREALRRLEELDPNHGLLRGWEGGYWGYVMTAYHILGQHEDELTVIQHLDPSSPTVLYAELRALAALGRTAELDSIARAELPATGQSGLIAFGVAGELTAHGYAESAHHFAQYWSDHPGAPPPSEPEAARDWLHEHSFLWQEIGVPWCYLGEKLETRSLAERARDEWVHGRAELALLVGDAETAATRAAELRNPGPHGLLLARILAAQGKVDAARAALAAWEARMVKARGTLRGLEIERASVLVRLGDLDGALAILSEGVGRRPLSNLTGWWNGHAYPDFAPLLSNPRFQALMKPRG